MTKKIKGVLFDLDGTLLDTNELIYNSFVYAFKNKLNMELPREEIVSLYGKPLELSLKEYVKDEECLQDFIKIYRDYNLINHDDMCKPFEGVVELLIELKKKDIKTAIVTSKRSEVAKRGMELGNIMEFFDVIVSPELTKNHKPHKEPCIKACQLLDVDPKNALMVGDSPYDLMSGRDAGCKTCAVEYTFLDFNELRKVNPTYIIKEARELLKLL